MRTPKDRVRVGLVVAFANISEGERHAAEVAWECAVACAGHWKPAFVAYGLDSVTERAREADIVVYLGESSRFERVAGEASRHVPVVFVKSTVERLLERPEGYAPRYRMCTGVNGIARALASMAPPGPSVEWTTLPWPEDVVRWTHLDQAEASYVQASVDAFREAAEARGIPWSAGLPPQGEPFSVFLTMHDPGAAILANTALRLWSHCTVLAADGMVSTSAPDGTPWPPRVLRVRHWVASVESESNRAFRQQMRSDPIPDYDSAGMLFGTLYFLDHAFAAGASPCSLEEAGEQPGPLGTLRMTPSGKPDPERVIVLAGEEAHVVEVV
ncbi:MAG: hypothetical protein ONB14_09140 [candidate division KSB1 bacterium]|nr:hypothetical protein [candidate division KSB1 bacterium]